MLKLMETAISPEVVMRYIALSGLALLFWTAMTVFVVTWVRRVRRIPISRRRFAPPDVRRLGYIIISFALAGAVVDMIAVILR